MDELEGILKIRKHLLAHEQMKLADGDRNFLIHRAGIVKRIKFIEQSLPLLEKAMAAMAIESIVQLCLTGK
ncbi:hypothetical protein [Methylobacter sp.]